MTNRPRSPRRPVAAALAVALWWAGPSPAQDTPLYRDPSPMEGPRIEGPLLSPLPPRGGQAPPPPSTLGPFQPANPGTTPAPAAEPVREPLLIVQPIPPPQPAMPTTFLQPAGDVLVRRKTTIRPPNGPIGRCHARFREALFGPPRPATWTTVPDRDFLSDLLHPFATDRDVPTSLFNQPPLPTWPLPGDR